MILTLWVQKEFKVKIGHLWIQDIKNLCGNSENWTGHIRIGRTKCFIHKIMKGLFVGLILENKHILNFKVQAVADGSLKAKNDLVIY